MGLSSKPERGSANSREIKSRVSLLDSITVAGLKGRGGATPIDPPGTPVEIFASGFTFTFFSTNMQALGEPLEKKQP